MKSLKALSHATARDLRNLQVKLTYVGTQTKPIPTVVFTTFYHNIHMDWFLPLRKSNLHYANDEIALWNFTVTPDEMKQVITALAQAKVLQKPNETPAAYLSLMLVQRDSRIGPSEFEAVLSREDAESVSSAIRDALADDNGLARKVMDLHQQLIFA